MPQSSFADAQDDKYTMNIGICGGTFDPFHRGHLDPILSARDVMQWDRLLYVPAYRQPFKDKGIATSGYHRFAMAVLATEELECISVTPRELERGAVSYTVDTLEELRRENPEATLDWVIGDDNLARLGEWKSLDRIFELANFTVLTRIEDRSGGRPRPPGCAVEAQPSLDAHEGTRGSTPRVADEGVRRSITDRVSEPGERSNRGAVVFVHNAAVPVSSTDIRARIRAGQPIDGLVHPRVRRYIQHNRLYEGVPS